MALGIFSEDCICTSLKKKSDIRNLHFEEIRVFQACARGEYISMNNKTGLVAYFVRLCAVGHD